MEKTYVNRQEMEGKKELFEKKINRIVEQIKKSKELSELLNSPYMKVVKNLGKLGKFYTKKVLTKLGLGNIPKSVSQISNSVKGGLYKTLMSVTSTKGEIVKEYDIDGEKIALVKKQLKDGRVVYFVLGKSLGVPFGPHFVIGDNQLSDKDVNPIIPTNGIIPKIELDSLNNIENYVEENIISVIKEKLKNSSK